MQTGKPDYTEIEYKAFPENLSRVAWIIVDGVKYVNTNHTRREGELRVVSVNKLGRTSSTLTMKGRKSL